MCCVLGNVLIVWHCFKIDLFIFVLCFSKAVFSRSVVLAPDLLTENSLLTYRLTFYRIFEINGVGVEVALCKCISCKAG